MYHSQWNQDKILNELLFKNNKNGVFVDVGAHDGVNLSNTLFFEQSLGWTGLCIEPIPKCFQELEKNRNCVCVQGCAFNVDGTVPFRINEGYTEMLSGIETTYPNEHKMRMQNELMQHGGSTGVHPVPGYRLETLFDTVSIGPERTQIKTVDYLTIDTEGSEFEVLSGINFEKVHINVIDVEENYPQYGEKIHNLLRSKGFTPRYKIEKDTVFINNDLKWSWDRCVESL
jgi:FkbM family methyltransferase